MTWGEFLGIGFFENAYLALLFFVPHLLATQKVFFFVFTIFLLYCCWKVIQKRQTSYVHPHNKCVFITGCDSGFGNDAARKLSSLGFTVFAGCLSKSSQGASNLTKLSVDGSITVLQVDITKDNEIQEAFEHVKKQCGDRGLHGLVNNAGIHKVGQTEIFPVEEFRHLLDVNLLGMVRVTQVFLPLVRKSKGRIVNVSSVGGVTYIPSRSAYCISKHAVETFSDTLRIELHRFDVKVSIIQPANFGGGTSILDNAAMNNVREKLSKMFSDADEEVRIAYGKDYVKKVLQSLTRLQAASSRDISPVTNDIVDALHNVSPKIRYTVAADKGWYDLDVIVATVFPYLPDWLKDKLIFKLCGTQ